MELVEQATAWARGDAMQGKIMLAIGVLLLVAGIAILKSNHGRQDY